MVRKSMFLAVCLLAAAAAAVAQLPQEADHDELRAMLQAATKALNARQVDALAPLMARDFVITTVDGRTFRDLAGFKTYIDELYGDRVESIDFRPAAAELTRFLGPEAGLSWGKSTDTYKFKDGDSRTMTSHWTATVQKQDGRWKLASLHVSANILDNPVVDAMKRYAWIYAAAGLAAGLLLGYLLRALTARRPAAA